MTTLFSIGFLIIVSIIANFIAVFVLNIAGIFGSLLATISRNKIVYIMGSIISATGQSFVYLAYTAFLVNWTKLVISEQSVGSFIWLFTFFAVFFPIMSNLGSAQREAKEDMNYNPQVTGLGITLFVTFVGFVVFVLNPQIMNNLYGWILN